MKVRLCGKHVEIKGKYNKTYAEIEEAAILTSHIFGEKILDFFDLFLFESYRSKAIWFR